MIRLVSVLFLLVLLFQNHSWAKKGNSKNGPSSEAEVLSCPTDKSADGIDEWRESLIQQTKLGKYNEVLDHQKKCFPREVPACVQNIKEYVQMKKNMNKYVDSTMEPVEGYTLKAPSDLPTEFQVAGNPNAVQIPKDIFKIAKKNNWDALAYKTRSTGGFDGGGNLSLFVVPGADKDIYLQISPPPDKKPQKSFNNPKPNPHNGSDSTGRQTLTVITVDKTKNPPVGQLRKMSLNDDGKTYSWTNSLSSDSCIACHTSPLRSISPRGYKNLNGEEKPLNREDQETVDRINNRMGVANLSWGKVIQGDAIVSKGPAINAKLYGWAPTNSETRKKDFIERCSLSRESLNYTGFDNYKYNYQMKSPPEINTEKVVNSMNCLTCHNGEVRGKLHENFSTNELAFKIMVDRSMPPGADLTQDERLALLNCLKAEINDPSIDTAWNKRTDWLRNTECTDWKGPVGSSRAPLLQSIPTPVSTPASSDRTNN